MDTAEKTDPFRAADSMHGPHAEKWSSAKGNNRDCRCQGPGSFTGLRIGLATAKMASYIWNVPLVGVDTLEALAWNMYGAQAFILPLLDAQKNNVYAALYGAFNEMWQEKPEVAASIDSVIESAVKHGGPVIAVGECADKYKDKLVSAGILLAPPHSRCSRAEVWPWQEFLN